MWPFSRPASITRRSPVVEDLAEHLRSGKITFQDLERHGISELGFNYLGMEFRVTWYPDGGTRDVSLDGDRFFASTSDARYLTRLARDRADRLFDEKIVALERKRALAGIETGTAETVKQGSGPKD